MSDHYQTLGVARNATPEEIKKAYRKLAAKHHPDKGGDTAMFQKVQKAYEALSDPKQKQEYDNPNPFGSQGGQHGFSFNFGGFNINDIFGTAFGQGFQQPNRSPSYRTTVVITLEQAYTGGDHTLQFNADGQRQVVKIQIPKGIQDGQALKYDNLIKNALLVVEFRIQPHPKFERDGNNLYSIHDISVLDLIVGTEFNFTTISGKTLSVKVPPKTQPGHKLRLQGEGMPNNHMFGDQYILIKPFIPDTIDSQITNSILQSRVK